MYCDIPSQAHYTQVLPNDFTDAYNAEMECSGVDIAEKRGDVSGTFPPIFQGLSTECTENQGLAEMKEWRGQDSNLRP